MTFLDFSSNLKYAVPIFNRMHSLKHADALLNKSARQASLLLLQGSRKQLCFQDISFIRIGKHVDNHSSNFILYMEPKPVSSRGGMRLTSTSNRPE